MLPCTVRGRGRHEGADSDRGEHEPAHRVFSIADVSSRARCGAGSPARPPSRAAPAGSWAGDQSRKLKVQPPSSCCPPAKRSRWSSIVSSSNRRRASESGPRREVERAVDLAGRVGVERDDRVQEGRQALQRVLGPLAVGHVLEEGQQRRAGRTRPASRARSIARPQQLGRAAEPRMLDGARVQCPGEDPVGTSEAEALLRPHQGPRGQPSIERSTNTAPPSAGAFRLEPVAARRPRARRPRRRPRAGCAGPGRSPAAGCRASGRPARGRGRSRRRRCGRPRRRRARAAGRRRGRGARSGGGRARVPWPARKRSA